MQETCKTEAPNFPELFSQMEDDIRFDCHRAETAFNRSTTKRILVEMGPSIFGPLAVWIAKSFPNMETTKLDHSDVDWNMFGVWVWLICSIRDRHQLPATPYAEKVPFCQQDMIAWHSYCLQHQR